MADHPQDAPRPPRRSGVLPPFIAPRDTGTRTPTSQPGVPRRRTSQLFTPPDVPRQSRPITPAWRPAAPSPEGASPAAAAPPPAHLSSRTPSQPSSPLAFAGGPPEAAPTVASGEPPTAPEHEGASEGPAMDVAQPTAADLTITGEQRAVEEVEVIDYGESSETLEPRSAAGDGGRATGMELEATEWSFGEPSAHRGLEVENFHAAEPLSPAPEVDRGAAWGAVDGGAAGDEPAGDERALSWSDAVADSDWFAPEPDAGAEPPRSEAEARGAELSAALAWPDADEGGADVPLDGPGDGAAEERAAAGSEDALASVAPDLRESSAPWAPPAPAPAAVDPAESVAESLERIARRVRDGEVMLPPDAAPPSDESALALALAALLRGALR